MRVDNVEATLQKRRNESWEQPVVSDVKIALETVHIDAGDNFIVRHMHLRRTAVASISGEDMDLMTSAN